MRSNKPLLSALLTAVLIFLAVFYIDLLEDKRHSQSHRSEVLAKLSAVRAKIEAALNSRLYLPKTMIAYVAGHPDITVEEFRSLARDLIFQYEGVRSIQLAKDSIVSHVYPLEGNEKAVGFRLLDNKQQSPAVRRAIDTRNTVVAGPVRLIQGGEGFISRTPVFLTSQEGIPQGGRYWGLSTVIIDKDWLLEKGGLIGNDTGLVFALKGMDGLGSHGNLFFGDESVLSQGPVTLEVSIPGGSWQIAAVPSNGWEKLSPLCLYIWFTGSFIALAAGGLVWSTLKARENLKEERDSLEEKVRERVAELAKVNEELNNEIEIRREKEAHLLEGEERLQKIIDGSSAVIFVKDLEGKYLLINSMYEKLFHISKSEVIGKTDYDIFPKDAAEAFREADKRALKAGKPIEAEEVVPQEDGIHHYISLKFPLFNSKGRPYAVCGIATDITERKRAADELMRLDKMESVGLLAGGIAHDFNNILAAMVNTLSLARITQDHGKCKELIMRMETACNRASAITHQLLTFSKGGQPLKKTIFLNDLIGDTVIFSLSGTNVRPDFHLNEDLWAVDADQGQINQIISNLVINAVHAMPNGGTIRVAAENKAIEASNRFLLQQGEYVLISFKDTGIGIPEEYIAKIFDPYYTTKGSGSGLGLAISYSIVKNHGGHIWVESEPGKGTVFHIYLPASVDKSSERKKKTDDTPITGAGRILLMDDEDMLRDSMIELIESLGYTVCGARNGEEALQMYIDARNEGKGFDAVILDLTIPGGMGGVEVMKRLVEMNPEVKAIVSSGYAEGGIMADYKGYGFSAVLAKPYTVDKLSDALHSLIQSDTMLQSRLV